MRIGSEFSGQRRPFTKMGWKFDVSPSAQNLSSIAFVKRIGFVLEYTLLNLPDTVNVALLSLEMQSGPC